MKKHFIKLFLIFAITFLFSLSNVEAACGDLVYDVLDMSITETKITIRGWAFIHKTCNGYYRKNNEADKDSTTNQQIKVNLCNDKECYYNTNEGNEQTREWFDFDDIMGYSMGGKRIETYTYQNIGFEVSFSIDEIKEKFKEYGNDQSLYFTIAVTNDDYSNRYDSGNCSGTEDFNQLTDTKRKKINGRNWVEEKMKVLTTSIRGIVNNESIEITATGTDKLLYTGWHTGDGKNVYIGWGQIYLYQSSYGKKNTPIDANYNINTNATAPGTYRIKARRTTNSYSSWNEGSNYYTCANYEIKSDGSMEYNDGFLNVTEYEDGYSFCQNGTCKKIISTLSGTNGFTTECSNIWITADKNISFAKVYGETTLKIKIKDDKKCEVSEPSGSTNMSCNDWTNLSSSCEELTIRENDSSAIVKITQNGYISNVFKSNLVNTYTEYNANSYDGGWFQYAIVYRNEVSFTTKNLNGNIDDINNAMKSRIKSLNTFNDDINLVITGLENITGTKLIKSCTDSGSFTDGNTLVTTCTFFLPSSLIDELGKIVYSEDETTANVTNKYYIDFNKKDYKVSVTLENLSRLSDNQAIEDSKVKNKTWFGTWEVKTGCNLKVTNRLIETDEDSSGDGKTKYKFIYRPIDLKNPFPSRFPGVNWYNWYIIDKNKDKKTLEDSYKKLNYYTILDNKTISEIKEYNKNNDYFGSVDEEFFKEYIKEGGS